MLGLKLFCVKAGIIFLKVTLLPPFHCHTFYYATQGVLDTLRLSVLTLPFVQKPEHPVPSGEMSLKKQLQPETLIVRS